MPRCDTYIIICNKISSNTSAKIYLQITIKAVNDLVRPDGIIPTLFVFGVYPRITNNSMLLVIVIKRTETIRKTIKEIKTLYTRQQVNNAFVARNKLNTIDIL
jgi:hypothetical protein